MPKHPFQPRLTLSVEEQELRALEREHDTLLLSLKSVGEKINALKNALIVKQYVQAPAPNHTYKCLCGAKFDSALAYATHQPECQSPRDSVRPAPAKRSGSSNGTVKLGVTTW